MRKGLNPVTRKKANDFFRYGDVLIKEFSSFGYIFHVHTKSNKIAEVYYQYNKKTNQMEWICNHTVDGWGCVMNCGDRTKPQCSHSLACEMLLKSIKQEK